MSALGVFLFILFVLLSIGIHEFGHFATAKAFGIKVERFFIGFGPKLWSVRRGETEYGIAALPAGGYVRIAGMNPFEEVPPEDRPRAFRAKPRWQRGIVLAAGSFTHFVIAFAIIAGVLAFIRSPEPTTTVRSVSAKTPAAMAGIRRGDVIVSLDGVRVRDWRQAVELIHARANKLVSVVVIRDGRPVTAVVRLEDVNPETKERVGYLGVAPKVTQVRHSLPSAIGEAGKGIGDGVYQTVVALKRIFSPSTIGRLFQVASGEQRRRADDPATIVGIGRAVGDVARNQGLGPVFLYIAAFNIFVGVANLMPLLPLDGGHLAVLGFESVTRKDVDMRKLVPVSAMVVSVLATLFVLLLYLDIVKPIPAFPG